MPIKKEYFQKAKEIIEGWLKKLPHNKEDEEKINKILKFYSRKRKASYGNIYNFTAAVLWAYSKINFLWEIEGEAWQQKNLAKLCEVSKSTLRQKSKKIMDDLKMELFDQRFARKEMADKNPMNNLCVDPKTGLILPKDDFLGGIPMQRDKHNYYYDAMEELSFGDCGAAIRLLRKSIEIDEHYVEAYVGMAIAYEQKNNKKTAKKYADKAFEKTKLVFPKWPKEMRWGIMENRQYMRAIHLKACLDLELQNNEKQAKELFKLLLKMNPGDNQGIRYLLAGMYVGLSGQDIDDMTDKGNAEQNWDDLENLVMEQNKIHKFWDPPEF